MTVQAATVIHPRALHPWPLSAAWLAWPSHLPQRVQKAARDGKPRAAQEGEYRYSASDRRAHGVGGHEMAEQDSQRGEGQQPD